MEQKEILERLYSLAQLDIDTANSYSEAVKEVDIPLIRETMEKFRDHHERHFTSLVHEISILEGKAPHKTHEYQGFVKSGFSFPRETGNTGALDSIEAIEKLTNQRYSEAASLDLPEDLHFLLESFCNDEIKHLKFIQAQIKFINENPHYKSAESEAGPKRSVKDT